MPTIPAPSNIPQKLPVTQPIPTTPPQPISSSKAPTVSDSTIAAILFIISLLLLCGLLTVFITRSSSWLKLAAPVLYSLPEYTDESSIAITGTGPKNANIEVSSNNTSVTVPSDKDGKFSATLNTGIDGKATYYAIARKKVLFFFTRVSDHSNEVTVIVDRTAPNIKILSMPKLVTKSEYTINGTVSEPAVIKIDINGTVKTITTDMKDSFTYKINFKEGLNTIAVVATDRAGNETKTAPMNTKYATGSVYIPSKNNHSSLPNSAGELSPALTTLFTRTFGLGAVVVGLLGFAASSSVVWLLKTYKRE